MINQILEIFDESIASRCWIGKYGRLAITGKQTVNGKPKRFPVSCAQSTDCDSIEDFLTDLIPDDTKSGVSFWKTVSPTSYRDAPGISARRQIKLAVTVLELVVWVNVRKVTGENTSASWCSDQGNIIRDAIKTIDCKKGVIGSGMDYIKNLKVEIVQIGNAETFRRAMSEYSIENIEALTVWPFVAFTLTVRLSFMVASNCIPSYECSPNELNCDDMSQIIFRKKITKTFADFAAAATTNTISSGFVLPAGGLVHDIAINPSTPFSGGSLVGYYMSIGRSGNDSKFASLIDIFTGAIPSVVSPQVINSMSASTDVTITMLSAVGNLNTATAGSVDIWIYYSILQ